MAFILFFFFVKLSNTHLYYVHKIKPMSTRYTQIYTRPFYMCMSKVLFFFLFMRLHPSAYVRSVPLVSDMFLISLQYITYTTSSNIHIHLYYICRLWYFTLYSFRDFLYLISSEGRAVRQRLVVYVCMCFVCISANIMLRCEKNKARNYVFGDQYLHFLRAHRTTILGVWKVGSFSAGIALHNI